MAAQGSRTSWLDRALAAPPWRSTAEFSARYFRGAARPKAIVDLEENGPALLLTLRSQDLGARFRIPPADAAAFLAHLPGDWEKTERVRALRVSREPLRPELRAEYDDQERLRLGPVYVGGGLEVSLEELERGRAGARWYFDGTTYHPVGTVPAGFREYFGGRRSLTREGDAIPEFLQTERPALSRFVAFRPGRAVRESRVETAPKIRGVRVESGAGDWLAFDPVYEAGDHRVALREILALQRPKGFIRRGTSWIPVDAGAARRQWGRPLEMRRMEYACARADFGATLEVMPDAGVRAFERALERLDRPEPSSLPKSLLAELRPYQKAGYDWLRSLRAAGLHGVLADDMGLGKTHQTMAFLLSFYEEGAKAPSLIVCPTSVLDSWIEKMRRFAPVLRPYRYHGARKPEVLSLPGLRAVATTYAVLVRDVDALSAIEWECVVLDEAQCIKTAGTQVAEAARALRARTRLALTGTPIENRLDELWSIFEFLQPGYLGSAESFRRRFEIPVVREGDAFALERLRKRIHPFKLRRVKRDVLGDLPSKVEDIRWCGMTPPQAALYRSVLDREHSRLEELRDRGKAVDYVGVFATLSTLKRICDHPALVLEGERTRDLTSGKFEAFKELMDEALRSGQKAVVFTQYLEMMDLIEAWLRENRIRFADLRGLTRDRAAAIREFNEERDCRVFVCSLLAGGVGIDLTAASVVIHYDRWWNAAKEDQATDRVHRIGQSRGVQVFKLVTRGTHEEKIDSMIEAKGGLMNSVVQVDPAAFKRLTREDLEELLTCGVT
ncbi:MAG: DEAD/DEAH box helicase, partial [Planctomycetes bacterium]|nr:DEAD/DEAH box helicase [Planctomycetota bacterium]